ncbi:alkaline phosphatase [Rhodoplanes roseus]|uniref:Alkaline phosphatase n=1 Tax=Rhodoplanes roseus TaxID=29409 RepID=A0A327KLY2_9BRAD|nr:alkaline phosphatase [Rhodoplanes roseus]
MDAIDPQTRTELEAAVFRRLVEHLRGRTDVQNIDLMNLAGFCRNCLSNWLKDAADQQGVPLSKEASREVVYGMPYEEWKAKHQREATTDQKDAFAKSRVHG